ncbi:lysosomal cobalamin transport escort protein LMBD1 isoform X5 [Neoarius graeffei]|uniref:lysosomal cobalamin transport escort protein LMBD1 isoform X5 n=1 Tax=Neoarius graeffei TaxID=443677 RepID=UPI00298C695C|nr:lysosomal cobalamin transport escort protein LMBD1 isoform X5 [Neoarius graeffei]
MKMAASTILLTETVLGWSIFAIVLLVILAFCWFYIRNYQSRQESEVISTITAICALAIALITSALLPVDIFLVSFMKYQNGTYKDWAASNETRSQIEDTILYGYYTLYAIILFCVFFWIPFVYFYYEEKDENISKCSQAKNAVKYTVVFVTICAALLLIGAFAPLLPPPKQNSTQWDKLQYLFKELGSSNGVVALSFSISSLTLIGMLAVITYTILLGVLFILVALLFFICLFISNLDKALYSSGMSTGLIVFGTNLTNPLNELLLALQPVFPLDYVLITVITMYFVFTSMAGIRNMGIWFFWIRLYKIRPQRTRPQALLFLCMILLLIVLHTNHMIYSLAPQYVMYGSQKYLWQENHTSAATMKTCHADAPDDQCTVTRSYLFLHKFWFFSTIYYFGNWAFLAVFLIGMMVSCCRGKKSVIEGEVEEDDSDCSDDEYMH